MGVEEWMEILASGGTHYTSRVTALITWKLISVQCACHSNRAWIIEAARSVASVHR